MSSAQLKVVKDPAVTHSSATNRTADATSPLPLSATGKKQGDLLPRRKLQKDVTDASQTSWSVRSVDIPIAITDAINTEQNSKWSFLQRLMAIEEAHNDRKRAREMKRKSEVQRASSRDNFELPDQPSEESSTVTSSLWTQGQIISNDTPADNSYINQQRQSNLSNSVNDLRFGNSHGSDKRTDVPKVLHQDHSTRKPFSRGPPHFHLVSTSPSTSVTSNATMNSVHHALGYQRFRSMSNSMDNLVTHHRDDVGDSFKLSEQVPTHSPRKPRRLRLPPILLPKIYSVPQRPLKSREFLTPTKVPGPITDRDWDDLRECRYIRHVAFGHKIKSRDSP